jgi:hypothetical protein
VFEAVGGSLALLLILILISNGIFMPVLRFAARRASGGRIAEQSVCLASEARQ